MGHMVEAGHLDENQEHLDSVALAEDEQMVRYGLLVVVGLLTASGLLVPAAGTGNVFASAFAHHL